MKIPSYRRIVKTDYPADVQDLIDRLAVSVNNGFDIIFEALNGKLDVENNLDSSIVDVKVAVDASGIPTTTTSIKANKATPIRGLMVIRQENTTNSSVYPTSGVSVTYTQSGNVINFNHLTGLPAGNVFNLRILILG